MFFYNVILRGVVFKLKVYFSQKKRYLVIVAAEVATKVSIISLTLMFPCFYHFTVMSLHVCTHELVLMELVGMHLFRMQL